MYQIVVTGPESTGKTTLCRALAAYYDTLWVPEYARTYLATLERPYAQADLWEIAQGQLLQITRATQDSRKYLFVDTHLEVLKIWSEYRYGNCDPRIVAAWAAAPIAGYVLCDIDVPWEYDPLREHPHARQELLAIYRQTLKNANVPVLEVQGEVATRVQQVTGWLETMIR